MPVNAVPALQWIFVAPWVQDDWRVNSKLTLNLGFRWDFNSPFTKKQDRLNYIFDPTIVNPISVERRAAGAGRDHVRGRRRRAEHALEVRQEQLPAAAGVAFQINEKTVLRAGYGKYFLNPTGQCADHGFSLRRR